MPEFLFDGWQPLLRTAAVGACAYVGLIALLRLSGKRTLSKMNAFDFVVTVALGSTLATILLSKDVSLAQGLLALTMLIALQFAITWSSVRARWVRAIATGEPVLLAHRGRLVQSALRAARVTAEEVDAAARGAGLAGLEQAEAIVLETDGSFSVVRPPASVAHSTLSDVHGVPSGEAQRTASRRRV